MRIEEEEGEGNEAGVTFGGVPKYWVRRISKDLGRAWI
jgi:hypothetical protein